MSVRIAVERRFLPLVAIFLGPALGCGRIASGEKQKRLVEKTLRLQVRLADEKWRLQVRLVEETWRPQKQVRLLLDRRRPQEELLKEAHEQVEPKRLWQQVRLLVETWRPQEQLKETQR